MAAEIRRLILQMATANPLWRAPRIHGELKMLGIKVLEHTVSRILKSVRRPPVGHQKSGCALWARAVGVKRSGSGFHEDRDATLPQARFRREVSSTTLIRSWSTGNHEQVAPYRPKQDSASRIG
jgi:hypothetical protein